MERQREYPTTQKITTGDYKNTYLTSHLKYRSQTYQVPSNYLTPLLSLQYYTFILVNTWGIIFNFSPPFILTSLY
jgi:hypothetical protein